MTEPLKQGEMINKSKKHWLVLSVCCGLAAAAIGLCINAVGVFYTPVSESLGVMRGTFASHGTVSILATAVISLFIPHILRKYPFKLVLIISVLIASMSTVMMAFSKQLLFFYLLGALRGASSGLFAILPLTMIINQWFDKKHGLATSVVLGFSGLAGALFSPLFAYFIESLGWQTTYIIKGVVMLLICLPAIFYSFSIKPEDDGFLPYGYEGFVVKENPSINRKNKYNYFTLGFICFFILAVLLNMLTGITQHLPGFTESIGHHPSLGATLISAAMMGNISSKLVIGVISDAFGAVKATIMMVLVNVIGILLLVNSYNFLLLITGSFLFGSIYSICAVGIALLTKRFFGIKNYTAVFSIVSFASNFGAAFALSLVGYLYDFTGSYTAAFITALSFQGFNIILVGLVVKCRLIKENKGLTSDVI